MKIFKGKTMIVVVSVTTLTLVCLFQIYSQNERYNLLLEDFSKLEKENKKIDDKVNQLADDNQELDQLNSELNILVEEKASEILSKEKEIDELKEKEKSLSKELQAKKDKKTDEVRLAQLSSTPDKGNGKWSDFVATYYDANEPSTGKKPGDPGYGITASGKKVEAGVTIAVDPNVIPLGSWVLVKYPDGTTEKRRADDTGSAINGNKIDIYIPSASISSGKHKVQVIVL